MKNKKGLEIETGDVKEVKTVKDLESLKKGLEKGNIKVFYVAIKVKFT